MMAERYIVGNLQMDMVRHEVTVGGKPVALTPKEFQILQKLMEHPARAFSRDELLDSIGGKATRWNSIRWTYTSIRCGIRLSQIRLIPNTF